METSGNKITILPQDVAANVAGRIVRVDFGPSSVRVADIVPAAKKDWTRFVLLSLGFAILMSSVLFAAIFLWPKRNWIAAIDERAGNSVVRVEIPDASGNGYSLGSGFVVASIGNRHLILTNRHVIQLGRSSKSKLSRTCHVVLRSGDAVQGRLAGLPKDPEIDLALLVVECDALRPLASIKTFARIEIGDTVVAVGHPLGLDFSVTQGIVSAKREGMLVQTSAAINHGNSGGPLIDQDGYAIGVNTITVSPEKGQSLGFAIRADMVLDKSAWDFEELALDLVDRIVK